MNDFMNLRKRSSLGFVRILVAFVVCVLIALSAAYLAGIWEEAPVEVARTGKVNPPGRVSKTWIVSATGVEGSHFKTITEAINKGRAGDRINVYAGVYKENLEMRKSMVIKGHGSLGDVVIENSAPKPLARLHGKKTRLENLTFRQLNTEQDAIYIMHGNAEIISCRISTKGKSGIHAELECVVNLTGNEIFECTQGGIYVYGKSRGVIEKNVVSNCGFSGITVRKTTFRVTGNTCSGNAVYGIWVRDSGDLRSVIEGNECMGNIAHGIVISDISTATVTGNKSHGNAKIGFAVDQKSTADLSGNKSYQNGREGLGVFGESTVTVQGGRYYDNKTAGVWIVNKSKGTLTAVQAFNNGGTGLVLLDKAVVTVQNGTFSGNKGNGILLSGDAGGTFRKNKISENELPGVCIGPGADPVFEGNEMYDQKKTLGLLVQTGGKGRFTANKIYNNAFSGVEVETGGSPILKKNHIYGNERAGIEVREGGRGTYEENVIYSNKRGPFKMSPDTKSKVIMKSNKLSKQ